MAERILIVDDESKMRHVLRLFLEKEGFAIDEAEDGRVALEMVTLKKYDLILLDVMMPGIEGWTVCREIRRDSLVPIIMLTARGEEYDKLFGFEMGVDDYITKPFSLKEVVYRIKAVLRRTVIVENNDSDNIELEALKINDLEKQVYLNDSEVSLTPKEYELLLFMAQHHGQVFTREQLLQNVWGYEFFGDLRTVDTHVKQLREKLGTYKKYVSTVWGVGYKLKVGD